MVASLKAIKLLHNCHLSTYGIILDVALANTDKNDMHIQHTHDYSVYTYVTIM